MAMLCDRHIRQYAETHGLITPYNPNNVQPCSYDVTLGGKSFEVFSHDIDDAMPGCIYLRRRRLSHIVTSERKFGFLGTIFLRPGEFALATTAETVRIPNDLAARVEGKSSLGRLGLSVHITAGFIDAGFNGQITLELKNETPYTMILEVGMPIAQLCFYELTAPAEHPYGSPGLGSHYQDQVGVTPSRGDICDSSNVYRDARD